MTQVSSQHMTSVVFRSRSTVLLPECYSHCGREYPERQLIMTDRFVLLDFHGTGEIYVLSI